VPDNALAKSDLIAERMVEAIIGIWTVYFVKKIRKQKVDGKA
jgi:hypothetical protein